MKLPFELVKSGALPLRRTGETKNVSSAGVLFSSDAQINVGDAIEYFITLPVNAAGNAEVRLRCVGKVVRQDQSTAAATLERYEFVREPR